jgi:hypothetical protein
MGELAGVPIEPDKQTRLLNACLDQAGVIAGGVPGGKVTFSLHSEPGLTHHVSWRI